MTKEFLILTVYVPTRDAEHLKKALFEAGAGELGSYSHCCWLVEGVGQFRPMTGANPAVGQIGKLEKLEELRIECVVELAKQQSVRDALRKNHPYEEPAYYFVKATA